MLTLPTSVWSAYFVELSPEDAVDEFVRAGYRTTEISDEHGAMLLARAKETGVSPEKIGAQLRACAADRGFSFPQGHLFLKVNLCDPASPEILKSWLDLYLALGVKAAVLHAGGGAELCAEERFARRTDALRILTDHLRGTDMKIALENLMGETAPRTADDLNALIDAVGDRNLGICLDTGHLHVANTRLAVPQSHRDFILTAGGRLCALHIADNDTTSDQHLMPFGRGTVPWKQVMGALGEIGYSGLFNYEIPGERHAPMPVLRAKLAYLHTVSETLMRDATITKGNKA